MPFNQGYGLSPLGDEYPDYPGGSFQPQSFLQPRNPAPMASAPTGTTLGNEIQPRNNMGLMAADMIAEGIHGFGQAFKQTGPRKSVIQQFMAAEERKRRELMQVKAAEETLKLRRSQFAGQQLGAVKSVMEMDPNLRGPMLDAIAQAGADAGMPMDPVTVATMKKATAEQGSAFARLAEAEGENAEQIMRIFGNYRESVKYLAEKKKERLGREEAEGIQRVIGGEMPVPGGMGAGGAPQMQGAPPMGAPPIGGAQPMGAPPPGMQVPTLPPPGGGMQGAPPMPGAAAVDVAPDDLQGELKSINAQIAEKQKIAKRLIPFAGGAEGKAAIARIQDEISGLRAERSKVADSLRGQNKSDEDKGRQQIAVSKWREKVTGLTKSGVPLREAQQQAGIDVEAEYGELPDRIHKLIADKPDKPEKESQVATFTDARNNVVVVFKQPDGSTRNVTVGSARAPQGQLQDNMSLFKKALLLKANGRPTSHADVRDLSEAQARKMLNDLNSMDPLRQFIGEQLTGGGAPGAGAVNPQAEADRFLSGQ